MSRPKRTTRTISKHFLIPEELVARMELELYSDVEERVPLGAQSELVTKLLRQHYQLLDSQRKEVLE